ncbi:unnamed protein product [Moneuplotes crassus]|uniref:GPN-loop GTPase 2 n=1 Tax=Euplotes crassus TaxID=5936 RepID=A0AAD1XK72_EUPCR|nr:unnamed protein product [Moneuplotes crassus]
MEEITFGQFVIGAPGSGKTTYCFAVEQYLTAVRREYTIINLDPANENMPYSEEKIGLDINELITLEDVMQEHKLGPNGGLTFCMEFLEENYEWFEERIKSLGNKYLIFDLPGQIELYTNHFSLRNIIQKLTKSGKINLAAIHIVDGICLTDATKFISTVLLCMNASIGMEMPMIHVLNKINLLADFPRLRFRLNDFLNTEGLKYILMSEENAEKVRLERLGKGAENEYESIKKGFFLKYKGLNSSIAEIIEDYSSVSLVPFDLTDKKYMAYIIALADKATGFNYADRYSDLEQRLEYDKIIEYMSFEAADDLQEKYLDKDNEDIL